VGDWHDTLLLLEPGLGNQNDYDFRFQAAQFGGHYAFHCHVLAHEDLGTGKNATLAPFCN